MEVIVPENEAHWLDLRKQCLTSTDIPALFDLSPYMTYAELWYRKKGLLDVPFEPTSRMRWGNRLEAAIAHGVAEDLGLKIRPMKEFYIDRETRLGSSFDYAVDPDGVLEIKNLDFLQFREKWEVDEDGNIEAPPHIEIQGQHQLLISDRKNLRIGALVGGNDVKIIERDPDESIWRAILLKSKEFWDSIDNDQPPAPDFTKDADLICKLYGFSEPGKFLFFENNDDFKNLGFQYKETSEQIKTLESKKESLKAQMLMQIGDAERVRCGSFSVSCGMIGPASVAYERSGYRMFKLNFPRTKK